MWKWVLIAASIFIGLLHNPVAAEEEVTMEIKLPFGGITKENEWTQVEAVIDNKGEQFQGSLHLGLEREQDTKRNASEFIQNISMQKGEKKSFFFTVPAHVLTNNEMKLSLTKGKEVVNKQKIPQLPQNNQTLIGVLDTNPNAFYFLKMSAVASEKEVQAVDSYGRTMDVSIKNIPAEALPNKSWLYDNLNVLAVGHLEEDKITHQQLAAIKEWVQRGGVLMFSTGPNQDSFIKNFSDLLPVKTGNSGTVTDLKILKELTGIEHLPVQSLPVYDKNAPLLVTKKVGAGILIFANYDVTAEPLASWQYNRQLWNSMLQKSDAFEVSSSLKYGPRSRPLSELSKLIPGVSTPSSETLSLIWVLYLLLVAPLLYFLLKRKDRREWAWAIVPALAIGLSVGVYVIGKQQVAKEDSSYSVSSIQLENDSVAKIQTVTSFLSLTGGTYAYEAEKDFRSIPMERNSDIYRGLSSFTQKEDGTSVFTLEDVPYLTVKQAFATGTKTDIGSFESTLFIQDSVVKGKVKNNTSFNLEETYLDLGQQKLSIGALKKGEEKEVALPFETFYMPEIRQEREMFQKPNAEEIANILKKEIASDNYYTNVKLIGYSSQALPVMNMVSEKHDDHFWNVLSQEIKLLTSDQESVVYPFGTQRIEVVNQEGRISSEQPYTWYVGKGSITFALLVKNLKMDINKITVPLDKSPYLPFNKEIYHVPSKSWKKLDRNEQLILQGNVQQYVNLSGQILLRFSNSSEQRLSLPEPVFQVEGKEWVQHDSNK